MSAGNGRQNLTRQHFRQLQSGLAVVRMKAPLEPMIRSPERGEPSYSTNRREGLMYAGPGGRVPCLRRQSSAEGQSQEFAGRMIRVEPSG